MKDAIAKLRALADELESLRRKIPTFKEAFQLFELPDLIGNVVDYLQPELQPYDALIYWYMFRHSIVGAGDVFVRVSSSALTTDIAKSFRLGQTSQLGMQTIREALQRLIAKGAISVAGDTNREGTLYRVHLPEEIAFCCEAMSKAQQRPLPKIDANRELDFYNIKANRLKIFERDKYLCHYCKKQLTRFNSTLDHIQPVSQGGDNSYENLVTACLHCNSQRNAQPLMDYLTQKKRGQNE